MPQFDPNLFKGREADLSKIKALAKDIIEGKDVDRRTLNILGPRGSGKTWLLLQLHKQVLPEFSEGSKGSIQSVVIDMDRGGETALDEKQGIIRWPESEDREAEQKDLVRQLLLRLAKELRTTWASDASLYELSYWLVRDVREKFAEGLLILFWDDIYSHSRELLREIENHILAPLASFNRVLIVMSGRLQSHMWTAPELRLWARTVDLKPFDRMNLEQILTGQTETSVHSMLQQHLDFVFKASGGYPRAALTLVAGLVEGAPKEDMLTRVDEQALTSAKAQALTRVIDDALEFVAQEERGEVRKDFELLSALNICGERSGQVHGFREGDIQEMLAGLRNGPQQPTLADARKTRDLLWRYGLLRWDDAARGYVLDAAVRSPIVSYLKDHKKPEWEKLNRVASEMYQRRADDNAYSSYRDYLRRLVRIHDENASASHQKGK